jgi:FAD-dependent urate hydroxylase
MYNLKTIIIGAGIAGLTTGIALRRMGYTVEIYEKTSKLRPAGAGISLWSNGIKVLNWLGLGDAIAQIGGEMNEMEYRTHTDEPLSHIDLKPLFEKVGQRPYPVSRTDLQELLINAFGKDDVKLKSCCVAVEENEDSVTAIFGDGHRATGDILIGADGVHSICRTYVAGKPIETCYADYVNWNGIVPASPDLTPLNSWMIYVGEGKRASMMPISDNRFYFFFGAPMPKGTTVEPAQRQDELRELFTGWCSPVQNLINQINPHETNRLEIGDLDPLEKIVKGRVALIGDAAHATTPTLGQGGCQAMEDAEILPRYLIPTNISAPDALHRYQTARKQPTADLVLKARKRTHTIYGKVLENTEEWYKQLKKEDPEAVINSLAKVILAGPFN